MLARHASVLAWSLSALLVAGCSGDTSSDAPEERSSLLYSVVAENVEIAADGDGFRLTLPADSSVAWFADRPERRAGTMDLAQLVAMWNVQGFDEVPPNAAVVTSDGAEQRQHVVELLDPVIDGSDVVMRATALDETTGDGVVSRRHVHDIRLGRHDRAELFIDSANLPPCPSYVSVAPGGDSVRCVGTGTFEVDFESTKGAKSEEIWVDWWLCSSDGTLAVKVDGRRTTVPSCPGGDADEPVGSTGITRSSTIVVPAGRAVEFWDR